VPKDLDQVTPGTPKYKQIADVRIALERYSRRSERDGSVDVE